MRCVVTGGAGFIGSNLSLELEKQGHEAIIIDNFSSGNRNNLDGFKGKVIEADVSEGFSAGGKIDAIFHLASITDTTFKDDKEMIRQNVEGFRNVLDAAKKSKCKLVYASSAAVYGNGPIPMKEDQKLQPLNAYAVSKAEMDKIASFVISKTGRHIVGLRYFNVFGPREAPKGSSASMILQLGAKMKKGIRPRIFRQGEQKRDHIYVKDVVSATIKALNGRPGIYNAGTGKGTTFNELVSDLNKALGTSLEPEYFDNPYTRFYQNNTQAYTLNAEKGICFKASYSLLQGIKDYKEWIK